MTRVYVGMSGGVDSSVTAALLVEQGYDVTGVYMKNWSQDLPGMKCPWAEDLADAKRVAVQLGIDFKVFDFICQNLPKNIQLQVSNSSAIRYLQLFDLDKSIQVFCNRGTSGIDGSTSTAIGAASATDLPTILITGDISFLYDSNALWNNYIPKNFKIILLNNSGGGIFRILPGHQETETFNTYFETSHQLNASHLAKMYGLDYFEANDEITLQQQYSAFLNQNEKPSILEVFTPEKENNGILLEFFRQLK